MIRSSSLTATSDHSSNRLGEVDIKQELVPLIDMAGLDEVVEEEEEEDNDSFRMGYADEGTFTYDTYGFEYSERDGSGLPLTAGRHSVGSTGRVDSGDGGGRFQCPLCYKRYKSAGSLQNHRSLYHRNEIGKQPKPFAGSVVGAVGQHVEFAESDEWRQKH